MEKKDYIFWHQAMREMRAQLYMLSHNLYVLKCDEYRPSLTGFERVDRFHRMEKYKWQLNSIINDLTDLAYYSIVDHVERKDKVLINQLCREKIEENGGGVRFETDVPDYYAITTNQECLWKILTILLDWLTRCTLDGAPECTFSVSERKEKGKLSFTLTRKGDKSRRDDLAMFNPPMELTSSHFEDMMVKFYNCRLMVQLLGGFICFDPDYKGGRQIIFDIQI